MNKNDNLNGKETISVIASLPIKRSQSYPIKGFPPLDAENTLSSGLEPSCGARHGPRGPKQAAEGPKLGSHVHKNSFSTSPFMVG